ncbi:hypothetical protein [Plesiomonas shigelloides]|uniref:hypothetical protein n=1 Tax=Plesiomonas shigelloides TaxID=703 RepID=UPI00057B715A|nr:hypothetical protein [Plesiomonas shigelloides]
MMKKKLVGLLGAGVIVASFSVVSAPTDGNLNFTFQGVIPPAATTPGSWKFVDLSGSDYTPSTLPFSTTRNNDGSFSLSMVNPEVFAIETAAAGSNFKANSKIKASVASTIINGSALNVDSSGNLDATPVIRINGIELTQQPQDIASVVADRTSLSMTASIELPKDSVKNVGGNVSMTSAVIFSADVDSSPSTN